MVCLRAWIVGDVPEGKLVEVAVHERAHMGVGPFGQEVADAFAYCPASSFAIDSTMRWSGIDYRLVELVARAVARPVGGGGSLGRDSSSLVLDFLSWGESCAVVVV